MARLLFVVAVFFLGCVGTVAAWTQCDDEDGGGICPDYATCCSSGTPGQSFCLPGRRSHSEKEGSCCSDRVTGCGMGFDCIFNDDGEPYCKHTDRAPKDQQHDVPRYKLRSMEDTTPLVEIYGFPMNDDFQAAYYSNMKEINSKDPSVITKHMKVERAIITVHGSSRNADEYLFGTYSVIPDDVDPETILIIAPYYVAEEETLVNTTDTQRTVLNWYDIDPLHPGTVHTFRMGVDAANAPISSFQVLDEIVQYLVKARVQYPNLKDIVVTGHSAGGQLVHRWALLSNIPAWNDSYDDTHMNHDQQSTIRRQRRILPMPSLRVVPANPRSYCYLDARRWIHNGTVFDIPDQESFDLFYSNNEDEDDERADDSCNSYNHWTWGLGSGSEIPCPYKDRTLAKVPLEDLIHRYNARPVIYLSGEFDTILQDDTCADQLQGSTRKERSERFYKGLEEIFGTEQVNHERWLVESSHDHRLMYQGEAGQQALFG